MRQVEGAIYAQLMSNRMSDRSAIIAPGEGHIFTARGSVMAFKAIGAETDQDFSLMERTLPPKGRKPPAHRHTNCSEAYFVLDGQVAFELDGESLTGDSGDFLLVPRGAAHTFGNESSAAARLLVLHSPALDGYFRALHELWSRPTAPSAHEERALMEQFGMERG
jgi:mannose-6-phosphate isomerase-like protein (cupin superfamily)